MTCTPRNASVFRGVFLRRCPLLFAVLDLLVLLDQAKSTEEKMHDRRNRFLLREVSRTSDWAFPARSGFTTFCHQKVVPKVSAGRKSRGTADGLRLKRYADELAPAFSTAHPSSVLLPDFSQCGDSCALRATMIICWRPCMASLGLRDRTAKRADEVTTPARNRNDV